MKAFKIIMLLFTLIGISSCENYSNNPIDYSPIYPICGEWRVRIKEIGPDTLLKTAAGAVAIYTFNTYNTSDNRVDSMWIRTTSAMVSSLGTMRGKILCDVPNLSFSGTDVTDISVATGAKFSVTEGKLTLNAIDMPSGVKADKISFKYTTTKVAGKTFLIEGFRQTLWPADQNFTGY